MGKKSGFFKIKRFKLTTIFVIIAISLTVIISIYNQHENDKKEQAVIVQQKEEDVKIINEKQEKLAKELEQKKLNAQKDLVEHKKAEEQKRAEEEKVKEKGNDDSTLGGNTTKEKAIEIVSKIIINKIPKVKVEIEYDHTQNRNGKDYYVVRAYDDMGDHINTLGWYYVQVTTGKAFEWNLIEDTLIPIN